MRATYLPLALFAILAASAPIELSETLEKRTIPGILSAGSVTINGQPAPPGSQPFPGVFVEKLPENPVCDASCLDHSQQPPQRSCIDKPSCQKTIAGAITPGAIYVLRDGKTSVFGKDLYTCGSGTCVSRGPLRGTLDTRA
ncbi:hypothetical protein MMC22_010988 [Lobaria immixta]|nr:hypothetical protein [Lobaria immixta]